MNEIIIKDIKIKNIIYEIRGKQVMLDSDVSVIKCHYYKYNILITNYNIGKTKSVCKYFYKKGDII